MGIIHAGIIFIVNYFLYIRKTLESEGYNSDKWSFSLTMFTAVILVFLY